jgi:ABC-type dipeptide/oligopeptide/nickel transport system permease subunit
MSTNKLTEVQQAIKQGERLRARKLLSQVLLSDQRNEGAWLMMARLAETEQQVIDCLEWVVRINPQNASARSALKSLKHKPQSQTQTLQPPTRSASPLPVKPVERDIAGKHAFQTPTGQSLTLASTNGKDIRGTHHKINTPLLIGFLIVMFVVLIGTIGPQIAPQDPMAEHAIVQIGDKWHIPPFDAFKVPGYILGTDEFGRDLLSRILYAVRPTLVMVSIVAIIRLFLGTLIGLGAGWSTGRLGRTLDGLISAAISVPVLMVALGAIAMLGADIGLLAFIVGLSINGWGETARFVRDQTQVVKGQLYIESSHALGASAFHTIFQHVLRQIMPMVWMLFAFEISGTLMVTAGLGFLGYFIGGDVWIEVRDYVSRRTSGSPELGQMLATSWVNLLQPWPLVLNGTVIFITVLGFNLLGDGLRSRLNPEYINRNSPLALLSHRFSLWFEEYISYPVSSWFKVNRLRPVLALTAVIALIGSLYLYQTLIASRFNPSQASLTVPGGQVWASERVDPYGTGYENFIGPSNPEKLWAITNPAGFAGSPVISKDGTIYVAGLDAMLMAVNPDGTTRWETSMLEIPLGPLALGPQGTIYVTDSQGGLSAYSPDGNLLWSYSSNTFGKPNHGAIVAPDETIYYLLEDHGDTLFALLPDGQLLWSIKPGAHSTDTGLRLSPDGNQIFVKSVVVYTSDGSLVDLTLPTQDSVVLVNQAHLLVGADGKTYLLAGHVAMQWTQARKVSNLVKSAEWNYRGAGMNQNSGLPVDAGVTPSGDIWLFYSGFYGGTSIYWLDPTGKILGNNYAPFNESGRLIGVDGRNTATICGVGYYSEQGPVTRCEAYPQDGTDPVWSYTMPEGIFGVLGGAMAPGRLYIISATGTLFAMGDSASAAPQPTATP